MLVAVDIGNTNIVLGFLDGDAIAGTYRITTKANHTSDEYGLFLTEFLRMSGFQPSDVDDVIICSVVPKVMHSFRSSIVKFLDIDPMVVGPGIKTGMNVRVDDPKSLGADILADCAGAYYEYGGPVLVADFGTATTFTHVSDKGVVDSGVITTASVPVRPLCGEIRPSCRKWKLRDQIRFWAPTPRPACRPVCITRSWAVWSARFVSSAKSSEARISR